MKKILNFVLVASTAIAYAACGGMAENKTATAPAANTANTALAKPASNAPTKETIMALEKSAYEAWKTKDAKFWDTFLTANFVGYGSNGRMDRAAAMKEYAGTNCEVKNYALSDDEMTMLGEDVALITYRTAVEGTCGGQKLPAETWAAGVYVREGDKWKGAYHAEIPVTDPKAAPAKPVSATKAAPDKAAANTKADPATDALLAVEKKVWEAWKNKDAKGLEETLAREFTYITAQGRMDREASLKTWSVGNNCDVKSFSLTEPMSVSLAKDVALMTFVASAHGACDGMKVPTERFGTLYIKDGDAWRAAFGMSVPM